MTAALVLLDAICIVLAITLATLTREAFGRYDQGVLDSILADIWPFLIVVWLLLIAVLGGYRTAEIGTGWTAYRACLNSAFGMAGLLATYLYLTQTELSRIFFFGLLVYGLILLPLGRRLARLVIHGLRRRGYLCSKVLMVGSRSELTQLNKVLAEASWLGLRVVDERVDEGAFLDDADTSNPVVAEDLLKQAERHGIDLILFATGSAPSSVDFRRYMWQFEGHRTQLAVVPTLVDVAADRVRTRPLAGMPIVFVEGPRSEQALSLSKRLLDVALASLFIVVFSPILAVSALLVALDGGPIIFKQTRIGRDGVPFEMWKFRSMVVDADRQLDKLSGGNDVNAKLFKLANDPRVTKVGKVLRRYSIDELPQLFNVVRGEMSLIGPRPALPREVADYNSDERQRLRVRPGLTGLWQVSGRSDLTWEQSVRLDLHYIDNWSPWVDIAILAKTLWAVINPRGAY